jgi:Kef-type K+ transport system membrane component KefB
MNLDVHNFLLMLVLILVSARLAGEVSSRIKIPPVIGEVAAGIIIGPSLLGWVEISVPIHLLAQIGIILLLFEVGIETDLGRLASAGVKALSVAVGGVVLPLVSGYLISHYLFHLSILASLFVGSTLTATSIGITLRILRDLKQQSTHQAQIIIGAAVLDDIIGIVLLTVLYEFALHGGVNVWNAVKVLAFIAIFFCLAPIAAKWISHQIRKWEERSAIPGLLPTVIVSLILFFAWLAYQLGAPELLGGFAAGLALSRQFFFPFAAFLHQSESFSSRVEEQMKPIIHLFTPIFFVAIGLSLNLREVNWGSPFVWVFGVVLLLIAILGKQLSGFFLRKETFSSKVIVGAAMVPRGEVGLIFANVALSTGAIHNDAYTALILVVVATTLIAPFFLRWLINARQAPSGS